MIEFSPIERLAVRLQHCPGVGPVAVRALLGRIRHSGLTPEEWWALNDTDWQAKFGMRPASIQALRQQEATVHVLLEKLTLQGVRILVAGTSQYPARLSSMLGSTAPPILYALGNLELFDRPSVGFCGSRKASPKGLAVASECARILAEEGVNIVSGYASGVDLTAHEAALAAGGTTTLVLAEGIQHFRIKQTLRPYLVGADEDRYLAVSEFPPTLAWKAHSAMTRNRTICGLSQALIVIESGLEGGTFEAGKTALALNEPLFCIEYADPAPAAAGNPYFLSHGAHALKRLRSGLPNLAPVLAASRQFSDPNPVPLLLREEPPNSSNP